MTPYGASRVIDPATPPLRAMQPPSGPPRVKEHHPRKVVRITAITVIETGKAKTSQQAINPNKPRLPYTITRLPPLPKSGGNPMSLVRLRLNAFNLPSFWTMRMMMKLQHILIFSSWPFSITWSASNNTLRLRLLNYDKRSLIKTPLSPPLKCALTYTSNGSSPPSSCRSITTYIPLQLMIPQ
jgi:hypothetical protein